MERIIPLILVLVLLSCIFAGCTSNGLTTSGCRVIRDDGEYVTYQTVCDNCGYEFGSPTTIYAYNVFYNVVCTLCGEIIYVRIDRN